MGISTSSYFSNAICGIPQVGGEYVDIFANTAAPKYALGTKYERQDGAVFKYGHFVATTTPGQLVSPLFSEVGLKYALGTSCVAPSSTYQQSVEPVGVYPGSKGSRFLLAGMAATVFTSGQFSGGYLTTVGAAAAGGGYTYRIKYNDGFSGTTALAGNSMFQLYDQLQASVTTACYYVIAPSKYNDLTPTNQVTAIANVPAGVSVAGSTAGYFGWVQQRGIVGCLCDAATVSTVGQLVTVASSVAGACSIACGVSTGALGGYTTYSGQIGIIASGGSAGLQTIIDLNIG
jgi:hypothetical protein